MSVDDFQKNGPIGVVQVLCGGFLISFSSIFVRLAHVGPTTAGFYRMLFGGVCLVVLAARERNGFKAFSSTLKWTLLGALFFTADLSFWHKSIHYIGPGLATIIANFQVFFLAAIGVFILRERGGGRLAFSIALAALGLFLLVGRDWNSLGEQYRTGVVLGLGAALAYTGYILTLKRVQRFGSAIPMLAAITVITTLFLGMEVLRAGESFVIPDLQSWTALVSYGVLCQALGWILISRGLVKVDASKVGLLLLVQPTLAFVWDMLFFSRPTTGLDIVGASLALVAIYLGNTRGRTLFKATRKAARKTG